MIQAVFGTKTDQSQMFLTDGTRIPVTKVKVADMPVVQVKTKEKDGYTALQIGLGVGRRKQMSAALSGHIGKAKLKELPRKVREIRVDEADLLEVGGAVRLADVLKAGDLIKVTGTSKGKGFAGGVKRHNFKGGPRTHGQSNRERAPGSLGQTTTPGRVYKGKRMAGHMGVATASITNLMVVAVLGDILYVKGLIPGASKSTVKIEKTGESKKFVAPLLAEEVMAEEVVEETKTEEVVVEADASKVEEAPAEKAEEAVVEAKEEVTEVKEEKNG